MHVGFYYDKLDKAQLGGKDMSRVCPVTGKGPVSGNNRSHSLRATRRKWNCNLQVRTVIVDGKETRVRMSTRAYRSLNKQYKDR